MQFNLPSKDFAHIRPLIIILLQKSQFGMEIQSLSTITSHFSYFTALYYEVEKESVCLPGQFLWSLKGYPWLSINFNYLKTSTSTTATTPGSFFKRRTSISLELGFSNKICTNFPIFMISKQTSFNYTNSEKIKFMI